MGGRAGLGVPGAGGGDPLGLGIHIFIIEPCRYIQREFSSFYDHVGIHIVSSHYYATVYNT